MPINKIGFVGLGLIGGSIAKTISRVHPEISLVAISGRASTISNAYEQGLIENESNDSFDIFNNCDYIFLCTPVQQNLEYLFRLKELIKEGCIITDVGSVKGDIHKEVHSAALEHCFIGGHPMAGSEKTGLSNATAYLLENAYYILTPTAVVPKTAVDSFRDFIGSLGAIPMVLDDTSHDRATAAISHLPHIIASALVNLVEKKDDNCSTMKTIAAGGFKDITRIASSSPVMWEEICLSNQEQILQMIDDYDRGLKEIRNRIAAADSGSIREFFQNAKDYRDSLAISAGSSIQTVFELYCDLIDEAGGIATIATILASNHLSIKNIGIINNREFEDGVLKIEMYDRPSYEETIRLLKKHHYIVYER